MTDLQKKMAEKLGLTPDDFSRKKPQRWTS